MILRPFKGSDFIEASIHAPVESGMLIPFDPSLDMCRALEGNAWSCWAGASVVACGGTIEVWPGRNLAWCLLTRPALGGIRQITNAAAEVVATPLGRVEATVRADYPRGHRWMEILGFELETPLLKQYGPHGEDHVGYVRINNVLRSDGIQSN